MSPGEDAAREIRRLHDRFERWFHGDDDADFDAIEHALAADFTFFPPNGATVSRSDLIDGLRDAFGTRPITIRIEEPRVVWHSGTAVLIAYEEWHDHHDYSTTRRSTALLTTDTGAPGGFTWHHVHETWLRPPPTRS